MKIVLAHDSLTQLGGAERVFFAMAEEFKEAPIYTLVLDKNIASQLPPGLLRRVRTTPLQYVYNLYPKFQHLLPLIPLAVWFTKIPACDILLSSSSGFAKAFKKPKNSLHINYCHTPTRFLWTDKEYIIQEVPLFLRLLAKMFLIWLKKWDLRAARMVDVFIANSKEVQGRIKKFYNRDAAIVYPFVDTQFWRSCLEKNPSPEKYFLIAGRLHAHKQNDMVIRVCNQLKLNLHVAGTGRDETRLKSISGPTISFLGRIGDEELKKQYSSAEGYIYPQLEDFGLMPLEAAACGTPTIGLNIGGSRETILPGKTGEWFSLGNQDELAKLLQGWDKNKYSLENLREHAEKFNKSNFLFLLKKIVSNLNGHLNHLPSKSE